MTNFPLFRLPFLAVIKGIQMMNVREQVKLSNLSRRCRFLVKDSVKKQSFDLEFNFSGTSPLKIEGLTAGNAYLFEYHYPDGIYNPDIESIKNLIIQMSGLFKNLSISMQLYLFGCSDSFVELISLAKNLNLKLGNVRLDPYIYAADDLCKFAFEECKNAKKFHIGCVTSEFFNSDFEQFPQLFNQMFWTELPWFSMKHVSERFMNCKEIHLEGPILSNLELNEFLKKWIEGSAIKYLTADFCTDIDMEQVLDGITAVELPAVLIKSGTGFEKEEFNQCFVIQQSNGTNGVICADEGMSFILSTVFEIENGEKFGEEETDDPVEIDDDSSEDRKVEVDIDSNGFFPNPEHPLF